MFNRSIQMSQTKHIYVVFAHKLRYYHMFLGLVLGEPISYEFKSAAENQRIKLSNGQFNVNLPIGNLQEDKRNLMPQRTQSIQFVDKKSYLSDGSDNTKDLRKNEKPDHRGNIQSQYSYQNNDRMHNLGYKAEGTVVAQDDVSYKFAYETNQSAREEMGKADGTVIGKYSYSDDAGFHDLSYEAESHNGFRVTGGSLAHINSAKDGSYSFSHLVGTNEKRIPGNSRFSNSDLLGIPDFVYRAGSDSALYRQKEKSA